MRWIYCQNVICVDEVIVTGYVQKCKFRMFDSKYGKQTINYSGYFLRLQIK